MKKITELINLEQSYQVQKAALQKDHLIAIEAAHKEAQENMTRLSQDISQKDVIIAKELDNIIPETLDVDQISLDPTAAKNAILSRLNQY
jgi:hypothetical protein